MLSVSSNKSSSALAAASIIGNNSDILIDILYCLPVKSLCVFRTVSKQWQSLISDPYFVRNYNLRSCHLSIPALFMKKILMDEAFVTESEFKTLVLDERNGIDCFPINIPIDVNRYSRIMFEHSCNGLVLYEVYDGSNYHTTYVVYNPSLKHCRTLPKPPVRKTYVPCVLSFTIAFDPAKSSYYEVLAVCYTSESIYHIEIYSSMTDSWRDAGDPFPFSPPGRLALSGVYWNGSVHWIDQWRATLHYFDIECELMNTLAMPTQPYPEGDYSRNIVYFKECRGHIHLMEMRKDDMPRADIWEMRMDYTGWNVKYNVDLSPFTIVYPSILLDIDYLFRRFGLDVLLIEEGEDSSRLILWILNDKVISFDLESKDFKEMYDVSPDVYVQGFQYMETLMLE